MEGNLCYKIDWASLIVERKFTVLLCFTFYLRAFSKNKPRGGGAYICRGLYTEGSAVASMRTTGKILTNFADHFYFT